LGDKQRTTLIMPRVRGSVRLIIKGFLDRMFGFIGASLKSQSITVTYHSSQSVTASGSFRFLPELRASSLPLWLAN
jgi:hypothetical protein